jgi:WD40 repeat protein
MVAAGDTSGEVRLWDPDTRHPIGDPLPDHTDSALSLTFSPDNRILAVGGGNQIHLWTV